MKALLIPVFRQQNNLYNSQQANTNLYVQKPGLNAICKHFRYTTTYSTPLQYEIL